MRDRDKDKSGIPREIERESGIPREIERESE